MPGPRDQLLQFLGLNLPPIPEAPSVEKEQLYRQMQLEEQRRWSPGRKALTGAIEGAYDFGAGLVAGDPTQPFDSNAEGMGILAGAALPFKPKGIPGMFSRVERVAESIPPGAKLHPNKLGSILRNRTSQEEVGWRGVDKLLQERSATNTPISRDELVGHLEKHPLDVNVIEKSAAARQSASAMDDLSASPQYSNYQMPGASNYRETLLQLDKPGAVGTMQAIDDDKLSATADLTADFRGHHWDEPNVLAHVRHNERFLPREGVDPDRATQVARILTNRTPGGPAPTLLKQMSVENVSKGRMLENVQSDWHQRGAHSGYTGSPTPTIERMQIDDAEMRARLAYQERLQAAAEAIDELHPDYMENPGDIMRPEDASFVWNRLSAEADNAVVAGGGVENPRAQQLRQLQQEVRDAQTAYLTAADAARRVSTSAVPDAPFKDSWAELALKQQLLDIAHNRPDLEWIGIAPSSELRARGEVISPEFQDKQLPRTLEKLLGPFGGKVEKDVDLGFGTGPEVAGYIERNRANVRSPGLARLTPKILAQLREKGFPLLAILTMLQAQQDRGLTPQTAP